MKKLPSRLGVRAVFVFGVVWTQLLASSAWAGGGGGGGGQREVSVPWLSPLVLVLMQLAVLGYFVFRQLRKTEPVPVPIPVRTPHLSVVSQSRDL